MKVVRVILLFITVSATGLAAVIQVPGDYSRIQQAIDAAQPWDVVVVAPGTYEERIDFKGKALTVRSSHGPLVTVIDGEGSIDQENGSVVQFISGEGLGSVLDGFTLTGGTGSNLSYFGCCGGGAVCYFSSPTIINNIISDNTSAGGGGIMVFGQNSSPLIKGNVIEGNYSYHGSGIYCEESSPSIENNIISDNLSGGIHCYYVSSPIITGNTIAKNKSLGGQGQGIWCYSDSSVTITDNTITGHSGGEGIRWEGDAIISNNIVSENQGGVRVTSDGTTFITGNIITRNTGGKKTSGGISCGSKSALITGNLVSKNSGYNGGGISCGFSYVISKNIITENSASISGGGIICSGNWSTIENNTIARNTASTGGGIYCCSGSLLMIRNNTISNNTALTYGGGIYCDGSNTTIKGNTVTYNRAISLSGGGIYCIEGANPIMTNNLFSDNHSGFRGGGIGCWDTSAIITNNTLCNNTAAYFGGGISCAQNSYATVSNSIFRNNDAPSGPEIALVIGYDAPSTLRIGASNVEGGEGMVYSEAGCTLQWGGCIIDADPHFVDPVGRDFHLFHTSPCRDTGDPAVPSLPFEDFEGDPRVALGGPDMGADEFHTHLYHTGDASPGGQVEIKMVGVPGTAMVALWAGSGVLEPPLNLNWGNWYLQPPFLGPLVFGPIPSPEGVAVLSGSIPAAPPGPYELPLQALIGAELTNLNILNVQ